MNKIQNTLISLFAFASLLAPVSYANSQDSSDFYLTVGGGVNFGASKSKYPAIGLGTLGSPSVTASGKKPQTGGQFIAGVGYNVMDNLRLEFVFLKPWLGKSKINASYQAAAGSGGTPAPVPFNGKMTTQINALQMRAYFDAFEISDMGKAYVGAGLGWAQVKGKVSFEDNNPAGLLNTNFKTKNKSMLTWFVGVGAFFNVADGTKLAVEYNYQDFGAVKLTSLTKSATTKLNAHAIIAKVMFDI
jgi:opacity protein-like surface antigen